MSDADIRIFLMDNGSLEPASVLSLRTMAEALSRHLNRAVEPISLLHSSAIVSQEINSHPAEIFEPAIEKRLLSGVTDFLIVPAFFGPSSALNDYLPRRVAALKAKYPSLRLRLARPLVNPRDEADERICAILEKRVRAGIASFSKLPHAASAAKPSVILVDHGSPVAAVTEVRNHIARQLRLRLADAALQVVAASMERRPGPEYSFSDPLLEKAFDQPELQSGLVIVALLFLSPGRHAGSHGDIAQICAAATTRHPALKPLLLAPIGADPLLIDVLADRTLAGLAFDPL